MKINKIICLVGVLVLIICSIAVPVSAESYIDNPITLDSSYEDVLTYLGEFESKHNIDGLTEIYTENYTNYPYFFCVSYYPIDLPNVLRLTFVMAKSPITLTCYYNNGTGKNYPYITFNSNGLYYSRKNSTNSLEKINSKDSFGSFSVPYGSSSSHNVGNYNNPSDLLNNINRYNYLSNHDISTDNNDNWGDFSNTVFFYQSHITTLIPPTQLEVAAKAVKVEQLTMGVVSLVPFCLIFVIGFLAFLKGWSLLLTALKGA